MPGDTSRRTFLTCCLSVFSFGLLSLRHAASVVAATFARPNSENPPSTFSFFHFSDTHISPRPRGMPRNENGRSLKTLQWFAKRTREPVVQTPYGIEAGLPAFTIHTGDVLEFGPVGHAWHDFETAVSNVACPICLVPGNHDNTWGEINHLIKGPYGKDSYSFDYGGCHFLCINSSGLLDPLPCLERRTLDWIESNLAGVSSETPLFIAMHHPLSGDAGYASEFDKLRLWRLLHGHRVALIFDGHWHTVHCQKWQGIDRVNGGATFGKHTGYNSVTLIQDSLRVVFEYHKKPLDRPKSVPLLEKSLRNLAPISCVVFSLPDRVSYGHNLSLAVPALSSEVRGKAWIDDSRERAQCLTKSCDAHSAELSTDGFCPGWHYVTVRVLDSHGNSTDGAERFKLSPPRDATYRVYETNINAGVTTQPVVQDNFICVAGTSGKMCGFTGHLEPLWAFDAHTQVVHSLAHFEDKVLVGDIEGVVHCIHMADGRPLWQKALGAPLYAAATIRDGVAYFLDGSGCCHAVCCIAGEVKWSKQVTQFCFESKPLILGNKLIAAAWDGFIYSIDRHSGNVDWSSWCPKGQKDTMSRYYSAADCALTGCDGMLYACDRGWVLGQYSSRGQFQKVLGEDVSGVSVGKDSCSIFVKMLDNRLLRMDTSGQVDWEAEVVSGRAPTPPVVIGNHVVVLSDTGILTALDASTGARQIEYSISPRLYCLSGIGTDGLRKIVAADMDGLITCLLLDT